MINTEKWYYPIGALLKSYSYLTVVNWNKSLNFFFRNLLCLFLMVLLVSGCASAYMREYNARQDAIRKGTAYALVRFIKRYPNSRYYEDTRFRIGKIALSYEEQGKFIEAIALYQRITTLKKTPFNTDARQRIRRMRYCIEPRQIQTFSVDAKLQGNMGEEWKEYPKIFDRAKCLADDMVKMLVNELESNGFELISVGGDLLLSVTFNVDKGQHYYIRGSSEVGSTHDIHTSLTLYIENTYSGNHLIDWVHYTNNEPDTVFGFSLKETDMAHSTLLYMEHYLKSKPPVFNDLHKAIAEECESDMSERFPSDDINGW